MSMIPPFFRVFTLVGNDMNHPEDGFVAPGPVGAEQEAPPKQKICLDINSIEDVQQQGNWRRVPVPVEPDAPGGPRRPVRRQRDVFEINPHSFILHMKNGNSWSVLGSFDEFVEMLTNFRATKEVV